MLLLDICVAPVICSYPTSWLCALQVELDQLDFVEKSCPQTKKWPDSVVSNETVAYCCGTSGTLPGTSLALICAARMHRDMEAYAKSDRVKEAMR